LAPRFVPAVFLQGFFVIRKKKKGKVLNRSVLYNFFAAHVKFTMFCLFASKADVDIIALK